MKNACETWKSIPLEVLKDGLAHQDISSQGICRDQGLEVQHSLALTGNETCFSQVLRAAWLTRIQKVLDAAIFEFLRNCIVDKNPLQGLWGWEKLTSFLHGDVCRDFADAHQQSPFSMNRASLPLSTLKNPSSPQKVPQELRTVQNFRPFSSPHPTTSTSWSISSMVELLLSTQIPPV